MLPRPSRALRAWLVATAWTVAVAANAEEPGGTAARNGSEQLRSRDYAAAAESFERAVELEPDIAAHRVGLGMSRSGLKQWDAAIAAYEVAIDLEPTARTYNNLANVYFRRGDYEAAARTYGLALDLDPDYLLARFHHGWCLRQINQPEAAQASFERCVRTEAKNDREIQTKVDCLFGLGSIRHRAGDYESSARMMERVVEVFPAHPEARYYLGMAYRQLGRIEDARRQLEIHAQIMKSHRKDAPIEKPVEE
jgi:protein O-GlcNAc transferase